VRLLTALFAGATVYLAVGLAIGVQPRAVPLSFVARARAERRRDWLRQAGTTATTGQFVSASVLGATVVGVVVFGVTGVVPLALIAGLCVLWAPHAYYSRRRARVVRERLAAWPDTLRDLVAHLRAPLSIHAALLELGRSGPVPLRRSFQRYAVLAGALDSRRALEVVRQELADPLSDRVIEVLILALDQGAGVVVEILEDLAAATAADIRLHDEIETAQLEVRMEAVGAAVLPFAVLGLLCATSDGYRAFYASPSGWFVIGIGAAMGLAGLLAIARLGRQPGEERILVGGGPG
jgi:tight adherence protein B